MVWFFFLTNYKELSREYHLPTHRFACTSLQENTTKNQYYYSVDVQYYFSCVRVPVFPVWRWVLQEFLTRNVYWYHLKSDTLVWSFLSRGHECYSTDFAITTVVKKKLLLYVCLYKSINHVRFMLKHLWTIRSAPLNRSKTNMLLPFLFSSY